MFGLNTLARLVSRGTVKDIGTADIPSHCKYAGGGMAGGDEDAGDDFLSKLDERNLQDPDERRHMRREEHQAEMDKQQQRLQAEMERQQQRHQAEMNKELASLKVQHDREMQKASKKAQQHQAAMKQQQQQHVCHQQEKNARLRQYKVELKQQQSENKQQQSQLKQQHISLTKLQQDLQEQRDARAAMQQRLDDENARERARRDVEGAQEECGVCLDAIRNCVLGCGHRLCCGCADGVQTCPFCASEITVRVKMVHMA